MTEPFRIEAKPVVAGRAEGEALVADAMLSFWGEVDAVTGKVIAVGHPLEGESLRGRVLVIRSTKGSSATPMVLKLMKLEGNAPAAFVNIEVDGLAALGCIVNSIPMVTVENPFDSMRTGDHLVVDAEAGVIQVHRG